MVWRRSKNTPSFVLSVLPERAWLGRLLIPPCPPQNPPTKDNSSIPTKTRQALTETSSCCYSGVTQLSPAHPSVQQPPGPVWHSPARLAPAMVNIQHVPVPPFCPSLSLPVSLSIQGLCNARHSPAPAPHGAALGARAGLCWAFADKQILPPQQSPSCPQRSQSNQTEWKRRQPLH